MTETEFDPEQRRDARAAPGTTTHADARASEVAHGAQGPTRVRTFTLLGASALTVMAGAVVAPSLPGIQTAFAAHEGVEVLSRLVLTLPALAIAVTAPFAGMVVDRLGRRTTLLGGLVLFGLSGASGGLLPDLWAILAGRILLGGAIAAIMTAATTLIADLFVGDARGKLLAWQAAFMGIGATAFLLAAGALADVSWRAPFLLYAASLLLVPTAWLSIPETRDQTFEAADTDLDARPAPLRVLLVLYGFAVVSMLAFYLIPVQAPFLLDARLDASGFGIGFAIAVMAAISACGSLLAPRVIRALGNVGTMALTFALVAIGEGLLSSAGSWLAAIPALAGAGLGLGMVMPNLSLWVTRIAPHHVRGRALGGLTAALFVGQFSSPIVVAPLTASGPDIGSGYAFLAGALVCAVFAIGCVAFALATRRRPAMATASTESAPRTE